MENHWIEDWLSERIEKEKNRNEYLAMLKIFSDFCQERGMDFQNIVDDYRNAKYAGAREEQMFLDKWNDLIKRYATFLKNRATQRGGKYTPLTIKTYLSVPKSFFSCYKILLDVNLPRHRQTYVIFHNRDLPKAIIRKIVNTASQRNRVIFLMEAESGLRADTIINLKYWQIKQDFEKEVVPMRILTPRSTIKYHVADRWSFVGEDGFKELKDYLEPRMPLRDNDFVFASEKPEKMKGDQFSVASISRQFKNTVKKLKLEKGDPFGKPGHYRMHGLRKYFFNNMIAPKEYRDFWMGHTISSSDEHYITDNAEKHRKVYAKGYEQLRILGPATPAQLTEIADKLKQKDKEIQELKEQNKELFNKFEKLDEMVKTLKILGDPELREMAERQGTNPLTLITELLRIEVLKGTKKELQKMKKPEKDPERARS